MTNTSVDADEKMRFRDFILQVERFLKYAPQGTNPKVLSQEAEGYYRRIDGFGTRFNSSKVRKLQKMLRELSEGTGEKR